MRLVFSFGIAKQTIKVVELMSMMISELIWYDIFVNRNWVVTRWQ